MIGKISPVATTGKQPLSFTGTTMDFKRILMAGDSHGDINYIRNLYRVAASNNCDAVYVVGDFGFGSRKEDSDYLNQCSALAVNIPLFWLDGNHEDHSALREGYLLTHFNEAAMNSRPPSPFVEIRPNLYHTWRGAQWVWSGRRFMSVGGAYSVNRGQRTKYVSWWPTEEMSYSDFRTIMDTLPDKVDVLLTHDIPDGADMGFDDVEDWKAVFPQAQGNRKYLQMIVEGVQPKLLIHGHMHHNYTDHMLLGTGKTCVVRGLAANFSDLRKASVILDLTSNPDGMVLVPVLKGEA